MDRCPHVVTEKVVDRLGEMREYVTGEVVAPITEWHYECTTCGTTTSTHYAGEQSQLEAIAKLRTAAHKTDRAIRVVRETFRRN